MWKALANPNEKADGTKNRRVKRRKNEAENGTQEEGQDNNRR